MVSLAEEDLALGILSPTTLGYSPLLVHLYVSDVDEFWARALAAGATEVQPLSDAYWGDRFGKLADPFGHYWSVASRVEHVTRDELVERTKAATGGAQPVEEADPVLEEADPGLEEADPVLAAVANA